ncbi:hypothetical protein DL98DRAFT_188312 [Cadophora sp. DSE1049]|nr:hypothetical protein DL98DRAFT_188312 [Cadophora sp. DSE1049]
MLNRCWAYIDLGIGNDRQGYLSRLKFLCDEFEVSSATFHQKGHRGVIQMVLEAAGLHYTSLFLKQIDMGDVWQIEEFIIKYQDPQFTLFRSRECFLPTGIQFTRGQLYRSRRQVYGRYWFMSPRFYFDSIDEKSRICVFHPDHNATHWGIGCGMDGDETNAADRDLDDDEMEKQDLLVSGWRTGWMEDNQRRVRNAGQR